MTSWLADWWYWCAVGLFLVVWAAALAWMIWTTDRILLWRERRRWKAGR